MKTLLIAVSLVLLSSCAHRAERMLDRNGPTCDKLGYERDTDSWRQCVTALEQHKIGRTGNALQGYQAFKPQPTVRCTTLNNVTTCQ